MDIPYVDSSFQKRQDWNYRRHAKDSTITKPLVSRRSLLIAYQNRIGHKLRCKFSLIVAVTEVFARPENQVRDLVVAKRLFDRRKDVLQVAVVTRICKYSFKHHDQASAIKIRTGARLLIREDTANIVLVFLRAIDALKLVKRYFSSSQFVEFFKQYGVVDFVASIKSFGYC